MISICNDINELHPKVRELAIKLLQECKKQGLNIKIGETYRTKERQDYLYAQGRTRSGIIVTYVRGSSMSSYHQWRLAFDIFNNVRGAEYDINILKKAGKIGEKLGLEWGGSWSGFMDTPHFQYTFGLSIKELNNGKKPPEYKVLETGDEYQEAIKKLVEKNIINTPDTWIKQPNLIFIKELIIKIGNKLFNVSDYETIINKLVDIKCINSPKIWLEGTYKIEHVKILIIKLESLLK